MIFKRAIGFSHIKYAVRANYHFLFFYTFCMKICEIRKYLLNDFALYFKSEFSTKEHGGNVVLS